MAGDDTLASIGARITDIFSARFAGADPNLSLVFLPFALTPPEGLVQPKSAADATPVVNPAQMAAFLAENFDEPYLMSVDEGAVHGKDGYYGRLSQIYPLAVTLAQPTHEAGSSAWNTVNAELAAAKAALVPGGMVYGMSASPGDWVLPGNAAYWSVFDSTETQAPAASAAPPRAPRLWLFKAGSGPSLAASVLEHLHAVSPPQPAPDMPAARTEPILAREALVVRPALTLARTGQVQAAVPEQRVAASLAQRPVTAEFPARLSGAFATTLSQATESPISRIHIERPEQSPPAPQPASPSASVAMHFEYMSVGIGYRNAGISMWNSVFIANPDWCVPGMGRGGLLPSPSIVTVEGQASLCYGMPVALIVVRSLKVSVTRKGQDRSAPQISEGFVGPFSLAGAKPQLLPDGVYTYDQPGMQVVALLCERLPVLPPQDAPPA